MKQTTMTPEWLFLEVTKNKELEITHELLFEIPEFCITRDITSMKNLALISNGNKPLTEQCFSIEKFETWCKEMGLLCGVSRVEPIIYIKSKF